MSYKQRFQMLYYTEAHDYIIEKSYTILMHYFVPLFMSVRGKRGQEPYLIPILP